MSIKLLISNCNSNVIVALISISVSTFCPSQGFALDLMDTQLSKCNPSVHQTIKALDSLPSQNTEGFYDRFDGPALPEGYDVHDGRGTYLLTDGKLWYYSEPRTGDSSYATTDSLGRTQTPALFISRGFIGEHWILDAKVHYDFNQLANGRSINFNIAFGDLASRDKNFVNIRRYKDDAIQPNPYNSLEARIFENGKIGLTKAVKMSQDDTYYYRIRRAGQAIEVLVSDGGSNYTPVLNHTFSQIEKMEQWFFLYGAAFGQGAKANIEYVSVKPDGAHPVLAIKSDHRGLLGAFKEHGALEELKSVKADDVLDAIAKGQRIDLKYAHITGVLGINKGSIDADVSIVDSEFEQVSFFATLFHRKVDFSGSKFLGDTRFIQAQFLQGANFSRTRFKWRPFFRSAEFNQPTSFNYSDFELGADFSSVTFKEDVSFADFSFGRADSIGTNLPDITFWGTSFCGTVKFISTLERPQTLLGEEISFERATIEKLIVSSGESDHTKLQNEQTGKGLWKMKTSIVLRDAQVKSMIFNNVSVTGITDLRGISYYGGKDSIYFLNADFNDLRMDDWPFGLVVTTKETRSRLVSDFDRAKNDLVARAAFFDLLPVSDYYDEWRKETKHKEENKKIKYEPHNSYRDYKGSQVLRGILQPFWLTSRYGTSVSNVVISGFFLTLFFSIVFLALDRGRGRLVRIEKLLEFKTRLSETPLLSFDEKAIEVDTSAHATGGHYNQFFRRICVSLGIFMTAFAFSFYTIAKLGFGNIRVRTRKNESHTLTKLAWIAWAIGYGWYILLIYTIAVMPILKGLF